MADNSRLIRAFALIVFLPLTLAAEELTSPRHRVRLATYEAGAPPDVVGDKASATVPFDFVRSGERYAGQVTFSFPETISGPLDQAGNFLQTRVTGQVTLTFRYTTRSFSPPTTLSYSFYGVVQDDAVRPPDKQCVGPSFGKSVSPGVYDLSYTLTCTWERVRVCPPDQRPSCTIFNTFIRFVTGTYPSSTLGGFDLSVFSSYSFGAMTIEPGVVSNDPKRRGEVTNVRIIGSGFVSNSKVSLGEGVTVSNVNVKSDTEIEAQITGYDNAREGPRDVEITRPDGVKQTGKEIFYVSSLAPEIEINPGIPMKCARQKPCIADHDTWVRVKLPCHGSGCENGKEAVAGRLHVKKDGSPIAGSPFLPDPQTMRVRAAGTTFDNNTLQGARDALNFRFIGDKTLPSGTYELNFEIDPRNLTSTAGGSSPDRKKNLVTDLKDQPFVRSRLDRAIHVSAIVDVAPRVARLRPIDPLGLTDFLRAVFPISKDLVTIDLSMHEDRFGPDVDETLKRLNLIAMYDSLQNQPAMTYAVMFTTDPLIGSAGASSCGVHPVLGFMCRGNASVILWEGDNSRASLAHELGHHQQLGDTYFNEPPGGEDRSSVNAACGPASGCTVETGHVDTLLGTMSVAVPTSDRNYISLAKRDIMGNAPRTQRWTDKRTWEYLYGRFMIPEFGFPKIAAAAAERRLVVRGSVKQDGTVTLDPFVSYTGTDLRSIPPGDYTVELRNAQGAVVSSRTFFVVFKSPHRAVTLNTTTFEVSLPYPETATRVVITRGGREVASRAISRSAPAVSVTAPNGGETIGATTTIRWNGSDADGDSLAYSVFYSPDGTKWSVIAADVTATSHAWKTTNVAGTRKGRIRVIATDGVNAASDSSDGDFTIAGKAPLVDLTSPPNGGAYAVGQPLMLSGFAYDLEDGELPASAISYKSDRSGELGSGRSVTVSSLPVGAHVITLTARDKDGTTATAAATITIFTPAADLRVIPAVGSTPGSGGSFFKTAVQIHNPTSRAIAGTFVYHVQGISGSASDPSLPYMLLPNQTLAYPDLLPRLGQSGLGSVDLVATYGTPPVSVVRIFNDAGDAGTTGMTEDLFRESEALKTGETAVLLAPIDPAKARYNIGIRTLSAGASMKMTLKASNGSARTSVTKQYGPTFFAQVSAASLLGMAPGANDAVVIEITAGSAIVYGSATDNLTQDPNLQIGRPGAFYAGTGARVVPVVGSAAGALGSFFRTSVQLHNRTTSVMSGRLVFHSGGRSGTANDPSLPYNLAPGATFSTADVLPAMGQAGIGSLDIVPTAGSIPVSVVRIYNDAGAAGSTGMTEEQVAMTDALATGQSAVLIAPSDLVKSRFNIGIRTLGDGASLTITLRTAAGEVRKTVTPVFASNFFQQTTAAQLLGETPLANDTVHVKVDRGSVIVYGTTTDNKTQDPSLEIAKKL